MKIIAGILEEEDFDGAVTDDQYGLLQALVPLLNSDTAKDVLHYLENGDKSLPIYNAVKDVLTQRAMIFKYSIDLRRNKVNANVASYNLYTVPFDYEESGQFCGYSVGEGKEVVQDLINNRRYISDREFVASKEDFEHFYALAELCLPASSVKRIKTNKTRVYSPKRAPENTYLGIIVRRLDQLEMGLKGIEYLELCERSGVSVEGSVLF